VTFKQVDVFSDRPLAGNPVAVCLGADALPAAEMQRIAAWTNLSETTFLLDATVPAADYRLRIFSPRFELPFAGHPTIGSAHAALEAGVVERGKTALVQECGVGLVAIAVEDGAAGRRIFFDAPPTRVTAQWDARLAELEAALGTSLPPRPAPLTIAVGPVWTIVHVADAATLLDLTPDFGAVAALTADGSGITAFALGGPDGAGVTVRSFAPSAGIPEDPVCGSGNAAVAAYLVRTGLIADVGPAYVAHQGHALGRAGRVFVRVGDDGRRIAVGGAAVTTVEGRITVERHA
jgi:PhzF family phenazine biosynthesis protein